MEDEEIQEEEEEIEDHAENVFINNLSNKSRSKLKNI
jgi:hypothetical protein